MCGLVGLVSTEGSNKAYKRKELFTQLLFVDTLRGRNGTGVAAIAPSKEKGVNWDLYLFKKALPGPDFIQLDMYYSMMDTVGDAVVVMGHNRAKTHGDATDKNAHPFYYGDIVLAHNGTLTGKGGLDEYNLSLRNDSANIAFNLDKMGEDKALAGLDGSFALTWFNLKDGTFNFARNEDRPLYYAKVKGENTMMYASEPAMLRAIALRNEVELEPMYYPVPFTHIKFSFPDFTKPKVTKFEKWAWKYSGGSGYVGNTGAGHVHRQSHGYGRDDEDVHDWRNDGKRNSAGTKTKGHLRDLYEAGFKPDEEEIMTFTHFTPYKNGKSKKGSIWGTIFRGDRAFSAQVINQEHDYYERQGRAYAYHKVEICSLQLQDDKPVLIVRYIAGVVPGENVSLKKGKSTDKVTIPEPKPTTTNLPLDLARQLEKKLPITEMKENWCHGPNGTQIPEAAYLHLISDGCAGCGDRAAVSPDRDEEVLWTGDKNKKPICRACYTNPKMLEKLGYSQTDIAETEELVLEL